MQINIKTCLNIFCLLFAINAVYGITATEVIQKIAVQIEIVFMAFLTYRLLIAKTEIKKFEIIFLVLLFTIGLFHFFLSYDQDFSLYFKIIGPVIFYFSGKYLIRYDKSELLSSNGSKFTIFICICVLPILVRLYQILSGDPGTLFSFFVNSNNYSYYLIVASIVVYFITGSPKLSIIYMICCFVLSKTLGAVGACAIAFILYYRKEFLKPKIFAIAIMSASIFIYLFYFSNLTIFERLKDSIDTFQQLNQSYSLKSFKDIDYADAASLSTGGTESLSFLFRIKNWSEITDAMQSSNCLSNIMGHGLLTVPLITSTGLVAHNDYLGLIYEMGFLFTILYCSAYFMVLRKTKNNFSYVFFLSVAVFHFTENLYYNFLITSLEFMLIGVVCSQNERKTETTETEIEYSIP